MPSKQTALEFLSILDWAFTNGYSVKDTRASLFDENFKHKLDVALSTKEGTAFCKRWVKYIIRSN